MRVFILNKFFRAFPAFRHRNYQLYFTGQLISLIGTWLQIVALGWLVLEITQSAFQVGLVSGLSMLPILLFSLFGGVIVDRFDKKRILVFTQTFLMIFAFILGILTVLKIINLYEIYTLAFLAGSISALDAPARQSFVIEMVGRESLSSAIALNAGIFNGARVLGPAVAGVIIALFGTGGAFLLNSASFLAVIFALLLINVKSVLPSIHPHPIEALKEGLHYSLTHQSIRALLIFSALTSIFGWSYTAILPFIIQKEYHLGVSSLGFFYGSAGIGALAGTAVVSAFSKRVKPTTFILVGSILTIAGLIIFTFTQTLLTAMPFLFLTGFGLLLQFSTVNSSLQHIVANNIRGRVMSLYTLAFMGMLPIGSVLIGFITEKFSSDFAIRANTVIMIFLCFYIYSTRGKINSGHGRIGDSI